MWEPDPDVPRKSGFLVPTIGTSSSRGFSWEQPYLQVISPSQDLVISPQFNTKVNPFLNLDWRRRFYSGAIEVRAGYTYEQDFDSNGDKLGNLTSRSYILAKGQFQIDPYWQWGFTAERASDPLIFDKYSVRDPFEDRGPLCGRRPAADLADLHHPPGSEFLPVGRRDERAGPAFHGHQRHLPDHRAADRSPLRTRRADPGRAPAAGRQRGGAEPRRIADRPDPARHRQPARDAGRRLADLVHLRRRDPDRPLRHPARRRL